MKYDKNAWMTFSFLSKFLLVVFLFAVPNVTAQTASLDTSITPEEKQQFDEILTPIMKMYNFIKYTASLIAVIALVFAGISYMFSGSDVRKRDTSKHMITYVLIGLTVIWAAPFAVNMLIA